MDKLHPELEKVSKATRPTLAGLTTADIREDRTTAADAVAET